MLNTWAILQTVEESPSFASIRDSAKLQQQEAEGYII
jgi:hypothetical protein